MPISLPILALLPRDLDSAIKGSIVLLSEYRILSQEYDGTREVLRFGDDPNIIWLAIVDREVYRSGFYVLETPEYYEWQIRISSKSSTDSLLRIIFRQPRKQTSIKYSGWHFSGSIASSDLKNLVRGIWPSLAVRLRGVEDLRDLIPADEREKARSVFMMNLMDEFMIWLSSQRPTPSALQSLSMV